MIIVVNEHAIYTSLPRHVVVGGDNCHQTYFSSLEEQVAADNPVRLMDAFVEKLELEKLGFTHTIHKSARHPPYAPSVFLN